MTRWTRRLTIMGKNNCPYCDLAKRHLDEHNIPYEYIKVDEDMEAYEKFRELGVRSVPQIMQDDNKEKFVKDFVAAWTKVMELDRFEIA